MVSGGRSLMRSHSAVDAGTDSRVFPDHCEPLCRLKGVSEITAAFVALLTWVFTTQLGKLNI